jgi:hypothetical protein
MRATDDGSGDRVIVLTLIKLISALRRVWPVTLPPGEGLLTERTAGVSPMLPEQVFMPHCGRLRSTEEGQEFLHTPNWSRTAIAAGRGRHRTVISLINPARSRSQ